MADEVPKTSAFKWSARSERAALGVARDEVSDAEIASAAEITDRTLRNWKAHPDFKARVDEHIAEFRARVRRRGIAIIENRVARLQRRCELLDRVIAERGASDEMAGVPGGGTGLLVHNVKAVGSGEFAERVDLYEVDTGLLNELRQHEKQAAVELGQWAEKLEHGGNVSLYTKRLENVRQSEL